MSWKYVLIPSILILCIVDDLVAQTPANLTANTVNNLFLKKLEESALLDDANASVNVNGSIFLNDRFEKGILETTTEGVYEVEIKYNILADVFYFKSGIQTLILDPRDDIKQVRLSESTYVVRKYEFKSKTIKGFLDLIIDGKYKLLAKKNITLRPAKPPPALQSLGTPAEYVRPHDTFYLELPSGKLEKIKTGKDVIYLSKNGDLKAKAKERKISISKSKDLPAVVLLLNELAI